jgi:spore coat protein SA
MIKTATVLHEGTIHPSPRQGATQTGVEEATKRFKKYEAYIFSSHVDGTTDIEQQKNVWQYRVETTLLDKVFGRGYLCKVASAVKELGIKLVHVRNRPLYMPILRKLLGKDIKLVLHEHNQNIADTLSKPQAISVLDSIDAYVGVSKFTYDFEITNKYPQYKNKARVILNGVNLEKYMPNWQHPDKVTEARKKYSLKGSKNVLFAGALRERKGIHHLVDAFKQVVKSHPDAKLIIAGGSKDNTEATDPFALKLKESAAEIKNNIIFTGYIPPEKMHEVYMLGDIFVGPSVWDEAFGLVFAEASACGLAVIGSNRGGIPEIIDNGNTGLLINDPTNPKEIADLILSLLDSPQKGVEMGRFARARMEEKFSWDRVAYQIEELYDELLK